MNSFLELYLEYALPLFTILWLIAVTRSILFWLQYIQLKQYRLDRIWLDIKQQKFWRLIFSSYRSILIGLFIVWEILLRADLPTPYGIFDVLFTVITLFFLIQGIRTIIHYKKHQLQLPVFTKKIWILFLLIASFEFFIAYQYSFWPEQLLLLEILQPLIVLSIFALLFLPNILIQEKNRKAAHAKRLSFQNLKVIGITGSYGKTTMKEYLSHLLAQKHKVLKTPMHVNVDTGIAQIIRQELRADHQFFVVEMGAYRKGEINRICDLTRPEYAILTGLSNQHLELFGSLEALENAKFELVEAVSDKDALFANADSRKLMSAFARRGLTPHSFALHEQSESTIKDVKLEKGMTVFSLNNEYYTAPIFGTAQLTNLAGAIAFCKKIGLSYEEIAKGVKTLPVQPQNMQIKHGPNEAIFIDDTYNANTQGVLAALRDLQSLAQSPSIFVFDQIIELGEEAEKDHQQIAKKMAASADYILLLPSPYRELMRAALIAEGFSQDNLLSAANLQKLRQLFTPTAAVLFEGRAAGKILNQLL